MRTIVKNIITYDEFIVLNKQNNPITGLVDGNFSKVLYDPDGIDRISSTAPIAVTINELGNGAYRVNFTPDKTGNWFLILYHAIHFAYGKGENYFCVEEWFDDIANILKRIVGLSQENYRIFNPVYETKNRQRCMTSATIKLYPTAGDVDTDSNAIAEYDITAVFNAQADMTSYKVKKV